MKYNLLFGNNLERLKELSDNSVDSIVTDPPYGLSFMNKKWDYDVPSIEFWKEVYRVLKPGGHILSFGGTRTYHRMVVNIEDAGFEIRDQIMWVYGSGFPKSHNIGKAVDKIEGKDVPTGKRFNVSGQEQGGLNQNKELRSDNPNYVKPKYDNEYEGWGTALKPANEPICVARKPLSEKTIAQNVLRWGTGGINIDGCRIGNDTISQHGRNSKDGDGWNTHWHNDLEKGKTWEGRFPANLIIECTCDEVIPGDKGEVIINNNGSGRTGDNDIYGKYKEIVRTNFTDKGDIHTNPDCPCRILDEQSGEGKSQGGKGKATQKSLDRTDIGYGFKEIDNAAGLGGYGDTGGASRFFYVPKVSKKERNMGVEELNKNTHPTVKPINLLTYLVRLITPPNGVVMDCYMGSGSVGIASLLEGFQFIGMEMDKEYFDIAEARINNYELYRNLIKKK